MKTIAERLKDRRAARQEQEDAQRRKESEERQRQEAEKTELVNKVYALFAGLDHLIQHHVYANKNGVEIRKPGGQMVFAIEYTTQQAASDDVISEHNDNPIERGFRITGQSGWDKLNFYSEERLDALAEKVVEILDR